MEEVVVFILLTMPLRQSTLQHYFQPVATKDPCIDLVAAIDIGIHNMAIAVVAADRSTNTIVDVPVLERTDITVFPCRKRNWPGGCHTNCPLHHSNTMTDWVAHYVHSLRSILDKCKVVLIERQPPGGFRCAEQLLFNHLREKAILVAPQSIHHYYYTRTLSYNDRKKRMVAIVQNRLVSIPTVSRVFDKGGKSDERLHDLADALLIAYYYVATTMSHPPPNAPGVEMKCDLESSNPFKKWTLAR